MSIYWVPVLKGPLGCEFLLPVPFSYLREQSTSFRLPFMSPCLIHSFFPVFHLILTSVSVLRSK